MIVPSVRLLALGIALVMFVGGCGQEATGTLGETIQAGDYQLTATDLENPAQPPDRFTNPKAGNRFVKIDVSVENTGQQHLPVAASYFTLKDSGGIDNPAVPGVPTDRGLRTTSIGTGQRTQAVLYFEMAANQHPQAVVFAPAIVGQRTRITVTLPG